MNAVNAVNAVVLLLIQLVAFSAAPDTLGVDSHPQREDEEIRRTVAEKMSFKAERVSLRTKKNDGLEAIRTPDFAA